MHDVLDDVRKKAQGDSLTVVHRSNASFIPLGTAYDLLTSRPEQEEALLSLLVNKLGDPERKVASRSAFLLQKLGMQHYSNSRRLRLRRVSERSSQYENDRR